VRSRCETLVGAAAASRVGCTRAEAKPASRGLRLMRLPSGWGVDQFGFNLCLFASIRSCVSRVW